MNHIHGLWHSENLPLERCYVDSWIKLHPDHIIKIWTFKEAELILKKENEELYNHYNKMPFLLQRVNILRMVLLNVFGGIYLDLDMECLKPLNEFFYKDIFFCRIPVKNLVCNAIIGGKARHPFWSKYLKAVLDQPAKITVSSTGLKTTGSYLITDLIDSDENLKSKCEPNDYFFPTDGKPRENSYTIHRCGVPRWLDKQYSKDGTLITGSPWLIKQ